MTWRALLQSWKHHGVAVAHYEWPADLGLGHEIIDPTEPGIDPAVIYPALADLIENTEPKVPAKPL